MGDMGDMGELFETSKKVTSYIWDKVKVTSPPPSGEALK